MGKYDTEVGYQDAYDLIDVYPQISYAVLEGAGHNLPIEKPRLFRSIVAGWLLELNCSENIKN